MLAEKTVRGGVLLGSAITMLVLNSLVPAQDYGPPGAPFDVGVSVGYYVLDGMGGLYYNGDPASDPKVRGLFFGDDVAEDIELYYNAASSEIGLWMLDCFGRVSAPALEDGRRNPAPINFSPWGTSRPPVFAHDIARDMEATPTYQGLFVLYGDGRVATVGDADRWRAMTTTLPFFGVDVAVDIEVIPDSAIAGGVAGLIVMDQFGGLHTAGVATPLARFLDERGTRGVYIPAVFPSEVEPYDAAVIDLELYMTGEPYTWNVGGEQFESYVRGFWQLDAFGGVHTFGDTRRIDQTNPFRVLYFPFNVIGCFEPLLRNTVRGEFENDTYLMMDRFGGIYPFPLLSERFGVTELAQNHVLGFDLIRDIELVRSTAKVPTPMPSPTRAATLTPTPTIFWATNTPTVPPTLTPSSTPTHTRVETGFAPRSLKSLDLLHWSGFGETKRAER